MKNIFALTILMTISSSAFAVSPFSGRIDYKVGDKIKYANQCTVRAQLDFGPQDKSILKLAATSLCTDMMKQVDMMSNGEILEVDMNGYSETAVNCIVCATK
jgi:hypothetical protein